MSVGMNDLYFNKFAENGAFTSVQRFLWFESLYSGHAMRKYEKYNVHRLNFINDGLTTLGFDPITHDELSQVINKAERIDIKDVHQLIISLLYSLPCHNKLRTEQVDELRRVIDNIDAVENTYKYYWWFQSNIGIVDFRPHVKFTDENGKRSRILDLYFIDSKENEFYASVCFEKNVDEYRLKVYALSTRARLKQKTDKTLLDKPIPRNTGNVRCLVILPYECRVVEC